MHQFWSRLHTQHVNCNEFKTLLDRGTTRRICTHPSSCYKHWYITSTKNAQSYITLMSLKLRKKFAQFQVKKLIFLHPLWYARTQYMVQREAGIASGNSTTFHHSLHALGILLLFACSLRWESTTISGEKRRNSTSCFSSEKNPIMLRRHTKIQLPRVRVD